MSPAPGHVPRHAEPRGVNGTPKEAGRLKSHGHFEALSDEQPESCRPVRGRPRGLDILKDPPPPPMPVFRNLLAVVV